MRLNDFQMITVKSLPETRKNERLEMGVLILNDHAEEAAAVFAHLDSAKDTEEFLQQREAMSKLAGFLLVDIVQICEGLGVDLEDVAIQNVLDYIQQAKQQRKLEEEILREVMRK